LSQVRSALAKAKGPGRLRVGSANETAQLAAVVKRHWSASNAPPPVLTEADLDDLLQVLLTPTPTPISIDFPLFPALEAGFHALFVDPTR
jgi:hypothetical protein